MGDDACWLDRTCLSCGRFLDTDHVDDERCPRCGAERITPTDGPPAAAHPSASGGSGTGVERHG